MNLNRKTMKDWRTVDCTGILKLHDMLETAGIPHLFRKWHEGEIPAEIAESSYLFEGYQVCYPGFDSEKMICSAVTSFASYGHEYGLIEIMGLLTPEEGDEGRVKGYLTAEEVFARIEKHWRESKNDNVVVFEGRKED